MTDIYDIKDLFLGFPLDITISIIYIVFILFLALLFSTFFQKYLNSLNKEYSSDSIEIVKNIDYISLLKYFQKKYIDSSKDIFYSELIKLTREILQTKKYTDLSKMTFDEIHKLDISIEKKDLIKIIYFNEFRKEIDDNEELRIELINKVKKLI